MSGTNNNNNKMSHLEQFVMNEELEPLTGTAKFRFVLRTVIYTLSTASTVPCTIYTANTF